jgi:hypothetical protein
MIRPRGVFAGTSWRVSMAAGWRVGADRPRGVYDRCLPMGVLWVVWGVGGRGDC